MRYNPKKVKTIYDEVANEEDTQEKNLTLRTEIPREFIKKYIKENDVVLDAGGGTGVNAIMMAKKSKHVTLIDISTEITNRAKENIKEAKLSNKINVLEGDICNLEQFKDKQFSFVVCVGDAISYVLDNRFKAIKELVRVAKKNSIIIIGCDSKYGFMRYYLKDGNLEEAIKINKNQETNCSMGPRTYTYTVDEMKQLLEKNGCKVLEVASTPTITDTVDRKQFYDPKKWAKLKKLEMEICTKPELLGVGNHLLFVARKK